MTRPTRKFIASSVALISLLTISVILLRWYPLKPHQALAPHEAPSAVELPVCAGSGWCWSNPQPQGNDIITMTQEIGGESVWVITFDGRRSEILQWKNNEWVLTHEQIGKLFGSWFPEPNKGWAVGENGCVLKWDGLHWRNENSSTDKSLQAVYGIGEDDIWAVGDVIIHWDGTKWAKIMDAENYLHSVWGNRKNNFWAVGEQGTILRWTGSSWEKSSNIPTSSDLYSIKGSSDEDAWAVGSDASAIHFDGHSWRKPSDPATGFSAESRPNFVGVVYGIANGVIVCDVSGNLYQLNTQGLSPMASMQFSVKTSGCIATPPSLLLGGTDGSIWRWKAGKYETISRSIINTHLYASHVYGNQHLWVAGAAGTALLFDGKNWSKLASPVNYDIYTVYSYAPSSAWFGASESIVLKYENESFQQYNLPVPGLTITQVWGDHEYAVVSAQGAVWEFTGQGWAKLDEVQGTSLWGSRRHDIWVGGDAGTFHRTSQGWSKVSPQAVLSLRGDGQGHVWALSNDAVSLWRDNAWQTVTKTPEPMQRLDLASMDQFGVVSSGRLFWWRGQRWIQEDIHGVNSVAILASQTWVFGNAGKILFKKP